MWRVHGLVGRVLSRCYGNAQLRLSQGYHVEDEVLNSSAILSTGRHASDSSSQRGEDEEHRKWRRTSQFRFSGLPRYTALDAVGWGAAAFLFMQICRRIHSQFSSASEQNAGSARLREPALIPKCGYRVLLDILSRRDVLPRGGTVSCLREALKNHDQSNSSSSSNTESAQTAGIPPSQHQGEILSHSSLTDDPISDGSLSRADIHPGTTAEKEILLQEDSVTDAAENLRNVADSSVPVILNIIGLESVKTGDYDTAFSCFLASAQLDYSKAQFNVGVCYERGSGVSKDLNKALQFYRCAAEAGHRQAQYRCAKVLLSSRGQQSSKDVNIALTLLHSAAAAGLTEAQLYLGVYLSQQPDGDEGKAVQFFRMAAQSGNNVGLLYLGQSYERGFGVPQCISTAMGLYQQASAAGNKQAKNMLTSLHSRHEDAILRSIRSAPCLSVLEQISLAAMFPGVFEEAGSGFKERSDWPIQPIPHSWSTGNLSAQIATFMPNSQTNENAQCSWTIGVG